MTVTSVVAPGRVVDEQPAPAAMPSTCDSSATVVEPAPGAKLVVASVHLIPPGTVRVDVGAIDDAGAVWPKSRKRAAELRERACRDPRSPCDGAVPAERRAVLVDRDAATVSSSTRPALPVDETSEAVAGASAAAAASARLAGRDERRRRARGRAG